MALNVHVLCIDQSQGWRSRDQAVLDLSETLITSLNLGWYLIVADVRLLAA